MTNPTESLVARLKATREYSNEQQAALLALAHHIIGKVDFTSEHARVILNLLARIETPAREAAERLSTLEAALAEWHEARNAFIGINPPGGKDALNRLSEAESALSNEAGK